MIWKRENIKDFIGTVMVTILFFLFLCSFSNDSKKTAHHSTRYEMSSRADVKIDALNNIQQFFSQEKLSLLNESNFNLFRCDIKIKYYNNLVVQKIISLQRDGFLIKIFIPQKFYYDYHNSDSDAWLVLS